MKVTVRKDRNLIIVNARNTQNENDVETIEITVPEEYEDFNKKIAFITDDGVVWDFIENNKYTLTKAITKYKKVKFYIWLTQDNKDFRSEERTIVFNKNQDANEEVTEEEISGFNKMINILEEEITEVTGLQEDLTNLINTVQTKLDNGDFVGPQGPQGEPGESYDDTEIKEEISDIKEEQTTQNTRIEELEEQVQELESNQLTGTSTGQSIYIEDSTNTKVRSIGLSGNSEQESTIGKNLFNIDNSELNKILSPGAGTTGGGSNIDTSDYIPVTSGTTYVLKGVTSESTYYYNYYVCLYDENKTFVERQTMTSLGSKAFSFIPSQSGYIRFSYIHNISDLQLEQGSTATPYEPYTGGQASPNPSYPQEIHSTGDSGSVNEKVSNLDGTQEQNISFPLAQGQKLMQGDYLADDGIHHVSEEITLDGSDDEEWSIASTPNQEKTKRFVFVTYDRKAKVESNYNTKCNYFTQTFDANLDKENIYYGFAEIATYIAIRLGVDKATTLEELKSWLSTHNVKVQYELAEEVIEPYTEEQQAVWEQIKALRTYKPVTHISSTDEVPATVDVTYVKDLETVINNLGGA